MYRQKLNSMMDRARSALDGRDVFLARLRRIALIVLAAPFVLTIVYAVIPPPVSMLMLIRLIHGNGIHKDWTSLNSISPYLARAVITSEDARFCSHHGVDWTELQGVVEDAFDADEAPIRGASTIPMQTVKNLFLWEGRAVLRKVLELPLAIYMDTLWTKRRMIEVYLNIVEWGPGIYGAEAAARAHFGKSAAKLTPREAALLAAVLPNPIKRRAGKPSKGVRASASRIEQRMRMMGPYLTCIK